MHRVLLIDDDRRLAGMLVTYLQRNGLHADTAPNCAAGLQCLGSSVRYAAVVLDLMLPDGDGLDLCRRIRGGGGAAAAVPIVMLTAKGEPMDRVVGLELGADDYLSKPFEPRELLARLRAVMRRPPLAMHPSIVEVGDVRIDPGARRVHVQGVEVVLTSRQFDLLAALVGAAGRVLTRERLMDVLSGHSLDANDRSIDVQVGRLRAALGDDPRDPRYILTVRGVGYCFRTSSGTDGRHG